MSFSAKNGLEYFWRLSFSSLEFFENAQKISLLAVRVPAGCREIVTNLNFAIKNKLIQQLASVGDPPHWRPASRDFPDGRRCLGEM